MFYIVANTEGVDETVSCGLSKKGVIDKLRELNDHHQGKKPPLIKRIYFTAVNGIRINFKALSKEDGIEIIEV